jgi:gluconokinase
MQQPYILGIDIGTGSTKAVAVNYAGSPLDSCQFYYKTNHPEAGYAEQDPEDIWQAFESCVGEMTKKLSMPTAIALSSAMHSLIPVDHSGKALYPMITWADARSSSIAEALRTSPGGKSLYEITGTPVYAMSPLSKIIWFRTYKPEVFTKSARFISIKEFIWHRLFGSYEVDYSIASGSGLFDIVRHEWHDTSLSLAGITPEQLSKPVNTTYTRSDRIAGVFNFLPPETPFIIGGSDGCLANLGSLAIVPGVAALTIGTSGAVRISHDTPIYNFSAMTFNYCLDERLYICGGPVNNGGIVIQWFLKNILQRAEPADSDYDFLFAQAETVTPGSEGLIFLPYLSGERAPLWTTETCGVFFGIMHHHNQSHFCRAVLEGICFSLKQVMEAVESKETPVNQINVSGGFVQSEYWIHMLSDITGKRICIQSEQDASSIGAAYLAMKSLKLIDAFTALKPANEVFIEPDRGNGEKYEKNYLIFKSLYPSLKESMHQLHQK